MAAGLQAGKGTPLYGLKDVYRFFWMQGITSGNGIVNNKIGMTATYMDFDQLKLVAPLLRAVKEAGYKTPSPIQQQAIPPVLAGRDLLGCAQTGTGKTAAFALPVLQLLAKEAAKAPKKIRTLVLTPTRELALQIHESFTLYGKYLPLKEAVVFGGVGQNPQVATLKRGVDILVATPGRLNDLVNQGYIDLSAVEIFVLDEADRMLDMGFVNDVKKVLKKLPAKKQTLLFSATMPDEIVELANGLLHNPAKVFVTPPATTVETIQQVLYKVDKTNKRHLLAQLLQDPAIASALVFTRTKHGADRVVQELGRAGIKAMAIHGNKGQTARQNALAMFKAGKIRVLVATDIAARGIDIDELSHVFNYDLPNVPETYVHRIGRTGRAGHGGRAISFCCFDELEYLRDIEKLIGFKIKEETAHDWPMQVLSEAEKAPLAPAQRRAKPEETRRPAAKQETGKKAKGAAQGRENNRTEPKAQKPPAKQEIAAPGRGRAKTTGGNAKAPGKRLNGPDAQNPYENLPAGRAIITKRPVWATEAPPLPGQKGDDDSMGRNNRGRGGKSRNKQNKPVQGQKAAAPKQQSAPVILKNENGVFDFSEAELAEDNALKVISRTSTEAKYASFEDFLKDH